MATTKDKLTRKRITNAQYRNAAKRLYHDEGTIEVDDGATVSRSSDGGAYVKAWVWVDNSDAELAAACCRDCGVNTGNVGDVLPNLCNLCAVASGKAGAA